ncbi:MAG TPA: peptidoglycan DD-metalloendopeptidase family protein [Candidatus Limnocylindria bacterium]
MGAPRSGRGGGVWSTRGVRATFVALVAIALVVGQQAPARADDPLQQALKQKQDLERAVADSRANAERYRDAADAFQAAVNAAQARITDLAAQAATAQSEADEVAFEIQITEEQLALASFQLDETRANADSLNAEAAALRQDLLAHESLYAKHLRVTYQQAMVSPLEMLLSSSSLTDFADRVQALIFVNRQDTQIAKDINALRADTEDRLADARLAEAQIVGLQKQVGDQQKALADQKRHYDALIAQMQASIAQQSVVAAQNAKDRDAQRQSQTAAQGATAALEVQLREADLRYEQLAAAAAGKAGLGVFTGTLAVWPLVGPITSPFGARWGGFHNGIDIARPMYTPIVAAAAGQVVTVGHPYLAYGDTAEVIIIAHGSNFQTLYGHLDDVTKPPVVKVGQWVAAGQVIAYEGMTGWTTGPHLHFMTIVNGRAVDPMQYLP